MRITFPKPSGKNPPSPDLSVLAAQREKTNHFYVPLQFHSALSPSIDAEENKMVVEVAKKKKKSLSVSHKMRYIGLYELLLMVKIDRGSLKPQTNFVILQTGKEQRKSWKEGRMMMEPFLSL